MREEQTPMNTKSFRAPAIAVAALTVGGLLLTACTPSSPTPTPTGSGTSTTTSSPTASAVATVGVPKDSAEAIADATAVTKSYWAITDQILNDGGKSPERIDAVSIGTARTLIHDVAAQALKKGTKVGGSRAISVTESYSSDATPAGKPAIKNGFVGLSVCNDVTASKPLNADGSPGNKGNVMRSVESVEVTYDSASSRWMVSSYTEPGSVVSC